MYCIQRLCAFLVLACASTLFAQQTVNNASLEGRVTDPAGALVAGASVTARNQATNIASTATANSNGTFRFAYLPVGDYELTAQAPRFRLSSQNITLAAGSSVQVSIALSIAGTQSVVTLDEDLQSRTDNITEVAANISTAEVTQLPYLSRNFLSLALLAPGVSNTNTAATQLFAETSAVPGQGLSINSQRNFSNSFLIDGLSANDDAAGLVQAAFPLDSIAELQVVTSGGQAEFGRALGGYLNFVTHSGTNTLHGTAYGFLRNQRLNAANALSQSTLPLTEAQFGASVGGPLQRNRAFYFVNAEQRNLNQNGILTISPANAAAIEARLLAVGYPGAQLSISNNPTTLFSNPSRATNLFSRFDATLSSRDTFAARYSLYHVTAQNSRGAGGLTYTSAAAALADLDQTIAISNIFVPTARTANETRAQFTNSNLAAPVNDPTGPAVSISGVATFGTLSGSPTGRYDRLYEVVDNLSHTVGAHSLRVGADFLYNDLTITFPMSSRGSYAFSSLANFQAGKYTTFTQSFGNPVVPQTNPNVGLYAQDEWHATHSLTLNAGVRYDLQFLQAVATDADNVSPRFGFAWTPFANARTVVRGSYGVFYDRVPLRALSNALESNGNSTTLSASTFVTLALSYGQAGAPAFPAVDSGFNATNLPANVRLSLTTLNPHLQNAYAQQIAAEVEQEVEPGLKLAINYQHVRGEHLLLSLNLNTPTCTSAVDPINLCRPVSSYANNKQYSSIGDSYYDGLAVSLVRRPSRYGTMRLSYAWSHAIDDLGEFFFSSPINNFNIAEDRSRSDDDQRHRLTLDGTLHTSAVPSKSWRQALVHGWQVGGIFQYQSALPFNVVTGGQTIQQTAQRPCAPAFQISGCTAALPGTIIGRNAGIGFDNINLNARLSRTFSLTERIHLEAIAQAFNALNHRNNLIPNATFGAGTFPVAPYTGPATAVADPRNVEMALRLSF